MAKGERLDKQWDILSAEHKEHIRSTIRGAVKALRRIGYLAVDSGTQIFCWPIQQYGPTQRRLTFLRNDGCESTYRKAGRTETPAMRAVTMLDFELMQACDESTMSPERTEMYAIFGRPDAAFRAN
jgi:hypothetical protein